MEYCRWFELTEDDAYLTRSSLTRFNEGATSFNIMNRRSHYTEPIPLKWQSHLCDWNTSFHIPSTISLSQFNYFQPQPTPNNPKSSHRKKIHSQLTPPIKHNNTNPITPRNTHPFSIHHKQLLSHPKPPHLSHSNNSNTSIQLTLRAHQFLRLPLFLIFARCVTPYPFSLPSSPFSSSRCTEVHRIQLVCPFFTISSTRER